jgi:predicted GTPase/uncharacterized protein (DUF697 family)
MAIDKNRTKELINSYDEIFNSLPLTDKAKKYIEDKIMGPALSEIRELIEDSRPPVFFLIGRSGHGKSSVINALANKKVAETGDIEPTTPESIPYTIQFKETYSTWKIIDSRGIFESTRPQNADQKSPEEVLKEDILKYKPDVILHIVSAPEIRNLANDMKLIKGISEELKNKMGLDIPIIVVLNKADTLGNPREWPPEDTPSKAALIERAVDYMAKDILKAEKYGKLDQYAAPFYGVSIKDSTYIGVIPICSIDDCFWNINSLSFMIGDILPKSTLLDFYQAQRRKELLRKISSDIIKKFSVIAWGVGSAPVPYISDIMILTPLQLLMISIVGSLSCKPFSKETAFEYLSATGVTAGAAYSLRFAAQQLLKIIPGGSFVSGSIAAAGTYGIGKSAEAYFFNGEIKKPEEFKDDWEKEKCID